MPHRRLAPLLLATLGLLVACSQAPEPETVRPALVIQPGADAGDVTAYAGEVHARAEPQLAFRIGGKIARRFVDAGARVAAGQALAELDPGDVDLQQDAARAALASAQSDLALASAERDRYKKLLDQQLVSRSLFDARDQGWRAAAARVQQARAQARVYGNQASYAVLRAPQAGVIVQRLAEAGQVVAAGQPVFVLAGDGEREVAISVPEQSLALFPLGRDMLVELWAAPGKLIPGKVREIAPAADPLTRTYAARVSFAAVGNGAEVGQSARVYARQGEAGTLSVPLSAIVDKDGATAVWVVRAGATANRGTVHLTLVRTGPFGEERVPVLSGLKPDDWVVAAGAHLLREGQVVQPVDRNDRAVALAAAPAAAAR